MANRTWEGGTSGDYSVAGNWVEGSVPVGGDSVRIPATSTQAITSGLNQSAVTLADFIVEEGAPAIGIETAYLQIAFSGKFRFAGAGTSLIDVGGSTGTVQVDATATPAAGYRGLYLKGSGIGVLAVNGGHVGLAWRMGETSTVTTIRIAGSGASLWVGSGVTNTTFHSDNGDSVLFHGGTTLNVVGGTVTTRDSGAWTTANVYGGIFYPNSTGTITNLNMYGGLTNALTFGGARTVTNYKVDPGADFYYDPAFFTVSNPVAPSTAICISTSRPVTV